MPRVGDDPAGLFGQVPAVAGGTVAVVVDPLDSRSSWVSARDLAGGGERWRATTHWPGDVPGRSQVVAAGGLLVVNDMAGRGRALLDRLLRR